MGIFLRVMVPFMVSGEMAREGEIVEVTESEAKNLLHRGKAALAVENDAPRVEPKVGLSVGATKDEDGEDDPAQVEQPIPTAKPGKAGK